MSKSIWTEVDHYLADVLDLSDFALDAALESSAAAQLPSINVTPNQGKFLQLIARIQGAAYGGGVGLACAADIVIAGTRARFCVSEAKFGILPAVIGPYLVNAVGVRQARRLALTCTVVDAAEALALGIVHQAVEEADLDAVVERCVKELLQAGPEAQGSIKRLFAQSQVGPVTDEVQELTAQTISRVRSGDEARVGFEAFVAKRPPPWSPAE